MGLHGFKSVPSTATVDDRWRVTLPKSFSEAIPWLTGAKPVDAWSLALEPGRYRLLSTDVLETNERLAGLLDRASTEDPASSREPFEAEPAHRLLLKARLLPLKISPRGPGWRLSVYGFPPPGAISKGDALHCWFPEDYPEIWSDRLFTSSFAFPLEKLI